jgi:hypothetical protein
VTLFCKYYAKASGLLEAFFGAEDRARTGHPDLGKVVLYQMSYFRVFGNNGYYYQIILRTFLFGSAKIKHFFYLSK